MNTPLPAIRDLLIEVEAGTLKLEDGTRMSAVTEGTGWLADDLLQRAKAEYLEARAGLPVAPEGRAFLVLLVEAGIAQYEDMPPDLGTQVSKLMERHHALYQSIKAKLEL